MEKKYFCRYCFQAFSLEEMLKRQIIGCFKTNNNQRNIKEYVKFKNYEKNIK